MEVLFFFLYWHFEVGLNFFSIFLSIWLDNVLYKTNKKQISIIDWAYLTLFGVNKQIELRLSCTKKENHRHAVVWHWFMGSGYPVTSMEATYSTSGLHGNGTVLLCNVGFSALDAASAETVFILAIKTAIFSELINFEHWLNLYYQFPSSSYTELGLSM